MARNTKPLDLIIVGAGPTGLTLAAACLRLGLRLRIIDKQSGPSTFSKAVGLQYRVSEILAILGVVDRFTRRGHSLDGFRMFAGDRQLLQLRAMRLGLPSPEAFEPRPILLPQSDTEELLGDLVCDRGGTIEWNTEFLGFTQDDRQVTARLRHEDGSVEEVSASWLVSCEGAHSLVRKQAGIGFSGKSFPLAFCMADVAIDGPIDHGQVNAWFHREGQIAAMPLPGEGRFRIFAEIDANVKENRQVTLDDVRAMWRRRVPLEGITLSDPRWISEFRINCRMADCFRSGRVFLAGDAAHIHSPAGGQGITTGTQDALNLAWKLVRVARGAPESLLDTYEEERMPQARAVLRATDRVTSIFFGPTLAWRLFRDLVFLPIMRRKFVQRKMSLKMSQLGINYRTSRLSRHESGRRLFGGPKLKAGDRTPDIAFRDSVSGKKVTLFDLLGSLRPIVLLGEGSISAQLIEELRGRDLEVRVIASPAEGSLGVKPNCLEDIHGSFRAIYGMRGDFLCLIRPDGHIGLFQKSIDLPSLRIYLDMLGPKQEESDELVSGEEIAESEFLEINDPELSAVR
jgi:2-polyprenyl-6-methoxyphenol hydroxylase-like FAD-dependent oxidoreductase